MAAIPMSKGRVFADDPEPADIFVQVVWFGSAEDGSRSGAFRTPPQPIEEYQDAVDWALSMAEQMAHPLYVVPMRLSDLPSRPPLERVVASMTNQERGELRRLMVTSCAQVLRDCDEVEVREAAYALLVKMGVVDE